MEIGTVRKFDDERGWGFIADSQHRDIFVHFTNIVGQSGHRTLNVGERVQFEVGDEGRGPCARNVSRMEA